MKLFIEAAQRVRGLWLAVALLGVTGGSAHAQSDSTATPPKPCSQPECRQFDFWIGEWDVTTPDGNPAGTNAITSILGGCVLEENWSSARSSFAGTSYNMWDAKSGRWHQTWVDNSGTLLLLNGGLVDGRLVLVGERPPGTPGAMPQINRITWTPKSKDEVQQHWELSTDAGHTWTTLFDGTYRRKK